MRRPPGFWLGLGFTLMVAAFLIVPVAMSITAGLTQNFFLGVKSGLTLKWVGEVFRLYSDTMVLSLGIALAPFWDPKLYAKRRDADIDAWMADRLSSATRPEEREMIEQRLRALSLR